MAKIGARKFQDMIGRTEFLQPREGHHLKADLLDMDGILKSAFELRSNVNILGGSVVQNFRLENRYYSYLPSNLKSSTDKCTLCNHICNILGWRTRSLKLAVASFTVMSRM